MEIGKISRALGRSAELLSEDEGIIDDLLDEIGWDFYEEEDGGMVIDIEILSKYPPSIGGRLILRAFGNMYPEMRLEKGHIDGLLRLIKDGAGTVNLPDDHVGEIDGGKIYTRDLRKVVEVPEAVIITFEELPRRVEFGNSILEIKFTESEISRTQTAEGPSHVRTIFCPPDDIHGLEIRPVRDGDRMSPMGMNGHSKKLSDIYTDRKVPRRDRILEPVVTGYPGGEIVALPGMGLVSEDVKVREGGGRVIEILLLDC